jgi:hypothetical protein
MAKDFDDPFCPSCLSYVHRYLDRCPACGSSRVSYFADATARWQARYQKLAEERARIAKANAYLATILPGREGFADPHAGDVQLARSHVNHEGDEFNSRSSMLTYRYYGGLPDHTAGADVRLTCRGGRVELAETAGGVLTSVPAEHVVAASASAEKTPLFNGWVGIISGGFAAFGTPTIAGGSLVVTYAAGDSFYQFAVGNRPGLLGNKGKPEFFYGLVTKIGLLADTAADAREQMVGPAEYAWELGLRMADDMAAKPPSSGAVEVSLQELERLKEAGLVAPEEYAAKRTEILSRL